MDPWSEWNRDREDECDGFQPGDSVGPYELLFASASGGMATVWAGRRSGARGADDIIAVKLLSDALQGEDDARAMFLDEARTASRILHPNVVEIFACGEVRERPYIAMEWIDGDSLAKIAAVRKQKGALLPLPWVLHVASEVCAGLHAAHEVRDDAGELLNLIHRDVTPQNVMVGFDGTVKVVDFGVAKSRAQTQVSRAGALKGKTAYFSPEQVLGETIDRRSDLFSMGCLMYLLVTGHPPFRGRGIVEVMNHIAKKDPQRPLEIMPELDPELDRIIMRALAKSPGERYQTAAELRRELEKVRASIDPAFREKKKKEVGALVTKLFPRVAEERKERIESAAMKLDMAPRKAPAPRPMRPEDATEVMMRHVSLLLAGPPEPTPASSRKSEPASARRSEPASARRSEPASARRSDPASARRSDPASSPKSRPAPAPEPDEETSGSREIAIAGSSQATRPAALAFNRALWVVAIAVATALVLAIVLAVARRG
jgi:serine/threonine-protein kinase